MAPLNRLDTRRTGREPLPLQAFMHCNSFDQLRQPQSEGGDDVEDKAEEIEQLEGHDTYRKDRSETPQLPSRSSAGAMRRGSTRRCRRRRRRSQKMVDMSSMSAMSSLLGSQMLSTSSASHLEECPLEPGTCLRVSPEVSDCDNGLNQLHEHTHTHMFII